MRRSVTSDILIVALLLGAAGCALRSGNPFASAQTEAPPATVEAQSTLERLVTTADEGQYVTSAQIAAQDAEEVRCGRRPSHLSRGNLRYNEVALTFDDGPHYESTRNILAVLSQERVRATFFVVGQMAAAAPDLVRAEADAGHEIANHTYHHLDLQKTPTAAAQAELDLCSREIASIIGYPPVTFRPPGGKYDDRVIRIARNLGLATILWTDDPADYASPGDNIILQRVLEDVGPGSVILLHDGIDQTIRILPAMIYMLRSRGLEFVTVSEMMRKM